MLKLAGLVALIAAPALALNPAQHAPAGQLSPQLQPAAAVIDSFHEALRRGDKQGALQRLAADALIFESGRAESKTEYASHHLTADAEFAAAVPSSVTRRQGSMVNGLAWIVTEGRVVGTYKGKAVNRSTVETAVLSLEKDRWQIKHLHWSSAASRGQ